MVLENVTDEELAAAWKVISEMREERAMEYLRNQALQELREKAFALAEMMPTTEIRHIMRQIIRELPEN